MTLPGEWIEVPRSASEEERRADIQAAIRRCLEGYKPKDYAKDLETPEEKALRRQYVLEDAKRYGGKP